MNTQDIILTIHQMDRDAVERVLEAARMRRDYLTKVSLRVGDMVQFDANSRGIQRGKIVKINPKRVKVQCGTVTWNVTPNLLKKVDTATATA
jgi:hypothetical protein